MSCRARRGNNNNNNNFRESSFRPVRLAGGRIHVFLGKPPARPTDLNDASGPVTDGSLTTRTPIFPRLQRNSWLSGPVPDPVRPQCHWPGAEDTREGRSGQNLRICFCFRHQSLTQSVHQTRSSCTHRARLVQDDPLGSGGFNPRVGAQREHAQHTQGH